MSKIYLFFIFSITVVSASTTEYLENNPTEEALDYTTEVDLEKTKSDVPGTENPLSDSTELKPLMDNKNIKIKLNDSEEIEIKPNSISREQLSRFRKFLNRKGINIKHLDVESTEIGDEKRRGKDSRQLNQIVERLKDKIPERLSDVTAEDILPLLPRNLSTLLPIIQNLRTEQCRKHAEYFLNGLHNLTKWAVQMFDAGTKIPEGVLFGSSYHFGNFDECINVAVDIPNGSDEQDTLKGQYCLATVNLSGYGKADSMEDEDEEEQEEQEQEQEEDEDSYHLSHTAWDTLKVPKTRRGYRKDVIHWSFCVPAACAHDEVEDFLTSAIDVSSIKGLQLSFEVPSNMCQVKRELVLDNSDISLAMVFAAFFLIIGIATIYDIFFSQKSSEGKSNSMYVSILLCFSAYTNLVKLAAYTPSTFNLDSIFGIKAITMILILMGHATAFLIGGPSMNSNFKEEAVLKVENGILLNNPLLVDTFLMIGAFLLCRLLLAELDKRKFINPLVIYIARIIRLTPAYAIVIAIYCTWFYKMDSGPLWEAKIGLERERCVQSWWANVLYINNYVNSEYLCMFQSWYLAVDTQFFFLAPIIIYPLWRWPVFGEISVFLITVVSIIIPFTVTFVHQLDPVLMMYAREISDLSSNPMYVSTYIKTHMRGMSYMIGLLLGYVIHRIQSSGYKVPKAVIWCGWIIAAFSSISAMFSVSVFYYRPYDAFESAVYAALHRVGWCVGIAWVIFACVTNNAGKINSFLSGKAWVPISRLSYCAYLVNGLVELHTIGTLRHTRYLTNLDVAKETMSHILLTYGLALFFSIIFEAPILGIESILLKKATNKTMNKTQTTSSVSVESQGSTETTTTNSNSNS